MPGRPWRRSEIEAVRKMHGQGMGARDIALAMNRTEGAIRSRTRDMGLRRFVHMDESDRAYIVELKVKGMTDVAIADLTGRTVTTVRRVLGVRYAEKRRWTVADTRKLFKLRAEGLTYPECAVELRRTPHACVMRVVNYTKIAEARAERQRARRRELKRARRKVET